MRCHQVETCPAPVLDRLYLAQPSPPTPAGGRDTIAGVPPTATTRFLLSAGWRRGLPPLIRRRHGRRLVASSAGARTRGRHAQSSSTSDAMGLPPIMWRPGGETCGAREDVMRYRYRFPPLQGMSGTGSGNTTGDPSRLYPPDEPQNCL